MAALRFSARAKADLISIYRYSLRIWGRNQAEVYADTLEVCFEQLSGNPMLGRAAEDVRKGLRRMEQGRHVIFYRAKKEGIVIVSIQDDRRVPR